MGLSGRRAKQRIPNDPRNLGWANDATKFGQNYLTRLGWDPTKGLGVNGEGRTSHIKVSQKLDMLGIGGAQLNDPNGIAWKQNQEFESVLKRLNEKQDLREPGIEPDEIGVNEYPEDAGDKRKRKRKRSRDREQASEKERRNQVQMPVVKAHRARVIASKRMASKSASAISEILGVAPTVQMSLAAQTPADDEVAVEKLTTSTKSVADYFKDRLSSKVAVSLSSNGDAPPGIGASRIKSEFKAGHMAGLSAAVTNSRMPSEGTLVDDSICTRHSLALLEGQEEKRKREKTERKARREKRRTRCT